MNCEIKVTKHAIEEYLNDNSYEKNPEEKLKNILHSFKQKIKYKKARYYHDYVKNATVVKYRDEAIVFNKNIIITYYRIISLKARNIKLKTNKKCWIILNWWLQEKMYRKAAKIKLKKIKAQPRKFYKQSKHKFNF